MFPLSVEAPSWPTVVIGIVSLLFGGHGFLTLWLKGRKDVVSSLIESNGKLATEFGEIRGKVELLENMLKELRKEKHRWRNRANRYKVLYIAEQAFGDDATRLLRQHQIAVPERENPHAKK